MAIVSFALFGLIFVVLIVFIIYKAIKKSKNQDIFWDLDFKGYFDNCSIFILFL